jgi:hypothetical protein
VTVTRLIEEAEETHKSASIQEYAVGKEEGEGERNQEEKPHPPHSKSSIHVHWINKNEKYRREGRHRREMSLKRTQKSLLPGTK